jgi:hypothetical protein
MDELNGLVVVFVCVLIYLIIACISVFREKQYLKRIAQHLLNVPRFDKGLIDCYVKVKGKITSKNLFYSPLSQNPCAFYQLKVLALWETKAKKPNKGMKQEKKRIFKQVSDSTQLALEVISNEKQELIHIDMAEFFEQPASLLHESNSQFTNCPSFCKQFDEEKYRTYEVSEYWYSQADRVVVYGKLTKSDEGVLVIKPTNLEAFASLICLAQQDKAQKKKLEKKRSKHNKQFRFYVIAILLCSVTLIILL